MSNKIERLKEISIRLAEISEAKKFNSEQITLSMGQCNSGDFEIEDMKESFCCLSHAYKAALRANKETDYENNYTYDEMLIMYGCDHCNHARKLKKENAKLNSERGRLNGQITKIGKSLRLEQ